jgi:type II secretory pathway component PulC
MSVTVKPKRRWFLKAELAVLVCIACIWVIMSSTTDIESTKAAVLEQALKLWPNSAEESDKAGENSANFPVPLPNKENIINKITKSVSETSRSVGGICYSTDKQSTIIDEKVLHEGDIIDGATIVKIYKDKVVFTKNGRIWEQNIKKDSHNINNEK